MSHKELQWFKAIKSLTTESKQRAVNGAKKFIVIISHDWIIIKIFNSCNLLGLGRFNKNANKINRRLIISD